MTVAAAAGVFSERCGQLLTLLRGADVTRQDIGAGPFVTTGIGGSEGPARLLAQALAATGRAARFVPVTAVTAQLAANTLILFSQSLSPNAKLAIAGSGHIAERWLVTGFPDASVPGFKVIRHAPASEDGLLVRVLAPTLASYVSLRALAGLEVPANFFAALESAQARGQALAQRCDETTLAGQWAFVTNGDIHDSCHGLRWKWLETLGVCDPPLYDVLNFAHGPLQRWHGQPLTLLALHTRGVHWSALAATASRCAHHLFELSSTLPDPWSFFEHDIAVNAILQRALQLGVGHGTPWRGEGDDVALYRLGSD